MSRTRIMIIVAFLVAFAAGGACAMALRPFEHHREQRGPSWLTSELELTPDQQKQMLTIWASVDKGSPRDDFERRHALQKERDESIRKLIPADKQAEFDKIQETYIKQNSEMADQRRKAFEAAIEKTKAILTAEQRKKYDQFLADRPDPRHSRGGQGFGHHSETQPSATAPAFSTPSIPGGANSDQGFHPQPIESH